MINIYCDESCHLEHDKQKSMVIGGVWCPIEQRKKITNDIYEIKEKFNINKYAEIKWTKVSNCNINYYKELIKYFFECEDLHFRAVVVKDKNKLNHEKYNQTHDEWYYKIYFDMLKTIIDPNENYNIYLDIKDTNSAEKVARLKEILCNNIYDFNFKIIRKVQNVRSEECTILQLADLIIGSICYLHRELNTSKSKLELIETIKNLSGYSLTKNTLYRENKFNLLIWDGK
ncbi:hypothetical protein B2H94_10820 [Clostridium sporogenes]|uniref:DUF3800 domain-containing protein n=1 Tax=Clostridium sporogenes TaxID=1509 RepID=A0ABD6RRI3_CLOSG|nr:DUF3800 domain-containing protein [Clostridium sporogenes]OSB16678.1 hypothetical protein B2H94_10820 [Clostridium sporogenes]